MQCTSPEISRKYDSFARWYDLVEGVPDLLGVRKLRQSLVGRASGKVLEVAVGTGKNFPYYPRGCRIIAVDRSREMLNVARKRAAKLSLNISLLQADAEALPFRDNSFDAVVSSLTTCTFPNPVAALREMARVASRAGKSFCWSMGGAIANGWPGYRIVLQIGRRRHWAVTGTANHLSSFAALI